MSINEEFLLYLVIAIAAVVIGLVSGSTMLHYFRIEKFPQALTSLIFPGGSISIGAGLGATLVNSTSTTTLRISGISVELDKIATLLFLLIYFSF